MFSSLDALMLNSHANAQNNKNTINLQNANSQQKEQTWVIVKVKEMKKQKVMKSSQKEVSIKVSFLFISSLSACSLWLWHCLDAVYMLSYM